MRASVHIVALAFALLALFLPTVVQAAESSVSEKLADPVVASYVMHKGAGVGVNVADFAQGQDIPFDVTGSLPADVAERDLLPYWFVVRPDEGLTLDESSPRVSLVRADGGVRDVTDLLAIRTEDSTIVAGSSDIKSVVPNLAANDSLVLSYVMRLNERSALGLGRGNSSYAHIEYESRLDAQASGRAGDAVARHEGHALRLAATTVARASAAGVASAASAPRVSTPRAAALASSLVSASISAAGSLARTVVGALARRAVRIVPLTTNDDVRLTTLSQSTEVKATVYSYELVVSKVAAHTLEPLAAARFALRDANGLWYVEGASWSARQSDATVMATDELGHASFRGVDSSTYELVELAAPAGYQVVGPVDVTISASMSDGSVPALTVTSLAAHDVTADAESGLVVATIVDPVASTGSRQALAGSTNNDPGISPIPLAKTGDIVNHFLPALLLSILALLCGVALRQYTGRLNAHRTSSHGGWDDTDERNGHGC